MNTQYNFLKATKAPKVIVEAFKHYGTKEIVGKKHNPEIMGWACEIGVNKVYTSDEIAWCGLFVGMVINRCGYPLVKSPLWARDWLNFGTKQTVAGLGDILVFGRDGGGHVGFYVGEDATCYHVLGGNQSNEVNITRILKSRLLGIRRCKWSKGQPAEVKKITYLGGGKISTNEA